MRWLGMLTALLALGMAGTASAEQVPPFLKDVLPAPTAAPASPVATPAPAPVAASPVPAPPVPSPTVDPLPTIAAPARPDLPAGRTLRGAILRAELAGRLPRRQAAELRAVERRARAAAGRLKGVRRAELRAVLARLDALAAEGWLTSSRIRLAGATLRRNLEVWLKRGLPKPGERLTFGADPAVFQYWPGRGLHHHPLASAGKANARAAVCLRERRMLDRRLARAARRRSATVARLALVKRAGEGVRRPRFRRLPLHVGTPAAARGSGPRCRPAALRRALDRLLELGAQRREALAWEYFVQYGGGRLPWVSAMAQATGAQALARGGAALQDRHYTAAAVSALGLLDVPAPSGVQGALMYSFAPRLRILNGHMQAVIGLHDVAALTGSRLARRLYRQSERSARAAMRESDTGAWTLYSRDGREAPVHYQRLVRLFARRLCDRTARREWCSAQRRFARYLREAPRIRVDVPRRARAGTPIRIAFTLSKASTVSVRAGAGFARRMKLARGRHSVVWAPPRRGRFTVRVRAVGPEGRRATTVATVKVRRARR